MNTTSTLGLTVRTRAPSQRWPRANKLDLAALAGRPRTFDRNMRSVVSKLHHSLQFNGLLDYQDWITMNIQDM